VAFCPQFKAVTLAGVALVSVIVVSPAQADTLAEAMRAAYRNNPTLNADRARQRATDELVPTAKSGWRPTINSQASISQRWSNTSVLPKSNDSLTAVDIQLSQPLFRGFRTVNGVKSAKANVKAGREQLLATEQAVLFDVAASYLAVVRDQQILAIRRQNVTNLQKQARAAQARFDAGEVTRTDVSQARARVSQAQGDVASAQANLQSSIAAYENVVGRKPKNLKYAKLGKVPRNLDAALATAQEINPRILSAAYVRDAARFDVKVAKGQLLPELSLQATGQRNDIIRNGSSFTEEAIISGVLSVPIYQAGREYSNIRQTKQTASQRQIQIIEATRNVREDVTSAWYTLVSSAEAITAAKAQVAAAVLALDGINQEYLVGSRTTIDVLNAEQEVLNARLGLINAEYAQYVSRYQLLQAMGKLTAKHLALGGGYYDATDYYDQVKDKWIGYKTNPVE
jgi:outer membrane protein